MQGFMPLYPFLSVEDGIITNIQMTMLLIFYKKSAISTKLYFLFFYYHPFFVDTLAFNNLLSKFAGFLFQL